MSCGVGHRRSLDLMLLRLCCRPVATALIPLLAWEPPYVVLKKKRKKERKAYKTPIKLKSVDWILMKTKVKGIKVGKIKIKVYKNWYV